MRTGLSSKPAFGQAGLDRGDIGNRVPEILAECLDHPDSNSRGCCWRSALLDPLGLIQHLCVTLDHIAVDHGDIVTPLAMQHLRCNRDLDPGQLDGGVDELPELAELGIV